jgi:hypothetical protein
MNGQLEGKRCPDVLTSNVVHAHQDGGGGPDPGGGGNCGGGPGGGC